LLLAVSPFLPWVSVVGAINLNLSQLIAVTRHSGNLAYIATGVGVAVSVIALMVLSEGENNAVIAALTAVVVGAVGIPGTVHLIHVIQPSGGLVSVGIGLALAGVAELFFIVGAVISASARGRKTALSKARPGVVQPETTYGPMPSVQTLRKCPIGHPVRDDSKFCPTCGALLD
jgi:hypothetical protein